MNDEKRNAEKINHQQTNDEQRVSRRKRRIKEEPEATKPIRWVQIRLIPIWLRIVLVIVLLCCAAVAGAMIGYGVLGDGSPSDVFKKETWNHIVDIINGKER